MCARQLGVQDEQIKQPYPHGPLLVRVTGSRQGNIQCKIIKPAGG